MCGWSDAPRSRSLAGTGRAQGRRQLRPQDPHRHRPVVLEILGQEHGRHASVAELAFDDVALGDRCLEPLEGSFTDRGASFLPAANAWIASRISRHPATARRAP